MMRKAAENREERLGRHFDLMEEALRREGKHFTQGHLELTYGLRRREVLQFIRLMEERSVLVRDVLSLSSSPTFHITQRPSGIVGMETFSNNMRRKFPGEHLCGRCGTVIAGRGRHRKSARGHTREECDAAMVELIHKT